MVIAGGGLTAVGGKTHDLTFKEGWSRVSSGASAVRTEVKTGGHAHIFAGGTMNDTTVGSKGTLYISGGAASNTTLSHWGNVYVSKGGSACGLIMSGGGAMVSAGSILENAEANNGGWIQVTSGGTLENASINRNSWVGISAGAALNNSAINAGATLYLSTGAAVSGTLAVQGGVISAGNFTHMGTILLDGGKLTVKSMDNLGYIAMDTDSTIVWSEALTGDFDIDWTGVSGTGTLFDYTGSNASGITESFYQDLLGDSWNSSLYVQNGDLKYAAANSVSLASEDSDAISSAIKIA